MTIRSSDIPAHVRNDPRFAQLNPARVVRQINLRAQKLAEKYLPKADRYASQLERDYAVHLDLLKRAGEISWWGYEPIKIRLADKTYYSVDFIVITKAGEWQGHECKGFWRDDARVKLKVAAEHFPLRFIVVTREGNSFKLAAVAG